MNDSRSHCTRCSGFLKASKCTYNCVQLLCCLRRVDKFHGSIFLFSYISFAVCMCVFMKWIYACLKQWHCSGKKKYTRKKQCLLTTLNSYPYDDDEVWIFRCFKLFCMSAFVSMTCHWFEKCTRSDSLLYHSLFVSVCMASSIRNVMSERSDMFVMSHTSAGVLRSRSLQALSRLDPLSSTISSTRTRCNSSLLTRALSVFFCKCAVE